MATVVLQKFLTAGGDVGPQRVVGDVTGNPYSVDGQGRVVVDAVDAPYWLAQGWVYANLADAGGGGLPSYGTAVVDFGPFPGKAATETTVSGAAIAPNAVLQVQVAYVASADHTADEHAVDPPMVSGQVSGNTVIIRANCSGRDRPVPPGIPLRNTSSQMPIARPQLQPYGKWNVGWAFVA